VIYCTHSPLFVGLDRFDQIRVVRKVHHAPEMPKKTCVLSRTLNEVAERIGQLEGKAEGTYTGETLRPRLTALLDHWISEGFFASVVVLVEGDTDRAAILGAGKANNLELDSLGISVLACNGKSGIFTAGAVFQSFGTPTFCIWDSDEHRGRLLASATNVTDLSTLRREHQRRTENYFDSWARPKKIGRNTSKKRQRASSTISSPHLKMR
jgi:putative ATP-dependent endonuclease of OLD family